MEYSVDGAGITVPVSVKRVSVSDLSGAQDQRRGNCDKTNLL